MRYALRNQDKIADKLGNERLESLLKTIYNKFNEPTEAGMRGDYKLLEFTDASNKKVKHTFAVVGGKYDVVQLAYISSKEE